MTTTVHPLVTIHSRTPGRIIFSRDGKVYTAHLSQMDNVTLITSSGHGNGRYRTYTRDTASKLFAAIEEVL